MAGFAVPISNKSGGVNLPSSHEISFATLSGMKDVEIDNIPICAIATSLMFFPLLPLGYPLRLEALSPMT